MKTNSQYTIQVDHGDGRGWATLTTRRGTWDTTPVTLRTARKNAAKYRAVHQDAKVRIVDEFGDVAE